MWFLRLQFNVNNQNVKIKYGAARPLPEQFV